MKKTLILLALMLVSIARSFAQDGAELLKKSESGEYSYEEVIQMGSTLTKDEIFKRAKSWIVANMKTTDNNIIADAEEGTINNTGAFKIEPKLFSAYSIKAGAFDFKFHVWVKDGRYKYSIDNIMVYLVTRKEVGFMVNTNAEEKNMGYSEIEDNKPGRYIKEQINSQLKSFVAAFKSGMTKSAAQKDNW